MVGTHSICSSDGKSLRFNTEEEHAEYKSELAALDIKFYAQEVERYGIWASNQNKYVQTEDQLNDWDGTTMHNLYKQSKYYII